MSKLVTDVNGIQLAVGDIVRIIGIPDLSGMTEDCREETRSVFQHLLGKYKKIQAFESIDGTQVMAELKFRIRGDDRYVSHTVWIEPHLLRKKQQGVSMAAYAFQP